MLLKYKKVQNLGKFLGSGLINSPSSNVGLNETQSMQLQAIYEKTCTNRETVILKDFIQVIGSSSSTGDYNGSINFNIITVKFKILHFKNFRTYNPNSYSFITVDPTILDDRGNILKNMAS